MNPVQIKGQKDGLWILLDDQTPTQDVLAALDQKLSSSNNFFTGAEVTINAGTRTFSPDEKEQLHELIEQKYALQVKMIEENVTPPAEEFAQSRVSGEETESEEGQGSIIDDDDDFMKMLDESFRIPVRHRQSYQEPEASDHLYENDERTLYFRGTVRSGQSLEFPGNVVILGDVNPGAYVVASGDIVVIGRLYGVVHAGAEGEDQAIVIAAGFFPSQLRIAQYIGRPPDEYPQPANHRVHTEKASIKDGTIVIEPIV